MAGVETCGGQFFSFRVIASLPARTLGFVTPASLHFAF